jgi:hypothetical protein
MALLCAAALATLFAVALPAPRPARALSADMLALDYLVQDVCTDPSGRVLPVDPYDCPRGDVLRPLQPGEPLPYHRYDQPLAAAPQRRQRHDSYPVTTAAGTVVVVNTFDFAPFNHFKPERDGWDVTMVRDGWASAGGTRTPREPGTTFFGAGCRPYNGWVFFPVSALSANLVNAGAAQVPISGVHWGSDGQPWPGPCPRAYQTGVVTSWQPLPRFQFGGIGGTPVKTIDAIRSIHGYVNRPVFFARGHLEVFYFTRLYGLTRWEVWAPTTSLASDPLLQRRLQIANAACIGATRTVYEGTPFVRTDCRDWTAIQVPASPEQAPFWPVPDRD